eukprot:6783390-Heterocapsa_arctica.AAC.1
MPSWCGSWSGGPGGRCSWSHRSSPSSCSGIDARLVLAERVNCVQSSQSFLVGLSIELSLAFPMGVAL